MNAIARILLVFAAISWGMDGSFGQVPHQSVTRNLDTLVQLADAVTIHRDEWGVPHIFGKTDEATVFGMGYAQAEDYFWQVEDNCIRAAGRYSELIGDKGLRGDLLNRMFEIVPRSRHDFDNLDPGYQKRIEAFAHGINYYLHTHPDVKPRLIRSFEPWHIVAIDRHFLMDFAYGRTHAGKPIPVAENPIPGAENKVKKNHQEHEARLEEESASAIAPTANKLCSWRWLRPITDPFEAAVHAAIGSNAWAVAPSKTQSGNAMLFINPHQPWYGWGQYYESHLRSEEGMNFSGAGFFGSPIPSKGHNEYLGWSYTVNDPDIADAWRVVFDDPTEPLKYRYGDGYRDARQWEETIRVREGAKLVERSFVFRKTHHGPIVKHEKDQTYLAVNIGGLFDAGRLDQAMGMIRARNFGQWREAARRCAIPMFNIAYADVDGNIFYCYNGAIPIRDPQFDWTKPVDGTDPRTQWKGIHPFDDLPQVFNPPSGYVQSCNSSPFVTTDDANPARGDYPAYMMEDADEDKRRAKMSRKILRESDGLTFERFQELAFDTTLYWPLANLPRFRLELAELEQQDPTRAVKVRPYLDHLLDWDCRSSDTSTQTTLCIAWYEELYGLGYPAETLLPKFKFDRLARLDALVDAANKLNRVHGDWKIPWGDVHRLQRVTQKADVVNAAMSFNSLLPSLPCRGTPGPLGIVFTVYSTPTIPFVRTRRYAVVGASYVSVVEFGKRVRAVSVTPFGSCSDRKSPNFLDQTRLFSAGKFKPAWFYADEVLAHAVRSYRPGSRQ